MMKDKNKDVIYPCRIPAEIFSRVRQLAEDRDLSASQVIRLALRQVLASESEKKNGGNVKPSL
jgi:predicted transcriptional regulator